MKPEIRRDISHWRERIELAAAFRWTARLNMHEAVANHFSLSVNGDGTKFLMNPNQVHFSRIRASELLLLNARDPDKFSGSNAPDPTAWFLHGAVHRNCPHARCVMHVHSVHATVLASLADSTLPPIDQNTAMFFNRHVIDNHYGGLALAEEGERCSALLADPLHRVLIMGNHGILVIGKDVSDTFNRMYYFERAAETYIKVLQTGRELRVMPSRVAEKTAAEIESYPEQAERHFSELIAILDSEGSDYAC